MKKIIIITVFATFFLCKSGSAKIINIPDDYDQISQGISNAGAGDTVLVQPGVYKRVYVDKKDIVIGSLTLTTGDMSYISRTVIDAENEGSGVWFTGNTDTTTRLNGFKIINGFQPYYYGGGVHLEGGGAILENLVITGNEAEEGEGGGINGYDADIKFKNVTIKYNSGRGLWLDNSTVTFDSVARCNIYLNFGKGVGNDIYMSGYGTQKVYLDTFTVINPTETEASPLDKFDFDIKYTKVEQVQSDLYVSPDGSDSNSGFSESEPLKTIFYALTKIITDADNPHTIYLSPGVYSSSTNGEFFPIHMKSFVTLEGIQKDEVILDAERSTHVLEFQNVDSAKANNLIITGGDGGIGILGGIQIKESHVELKSVDVVQNYGIGIDIDSRSVVKLTNSSISKNEDIGLDFSGYSNNLFLAGVSITENKGVGLFTQNPVEFSSDNRCNIYLNHGSGASDISSLYPMHVVLDTFTVLNPTERHVYPIEGMTFDILNGKFQQVDSSLYVSPNGVDTNSGLSPSAPLRTLFAAYSKIIADSLNPQTIYLLNGTYSPSVNNESFPIQMMDWVSLLGESKQDVILDAEKQPHVLQLTDTKGINIENLTITGASQGGIVCENTGPMITDVIIVNNSAWDGGGINLSGSNPFFKNVDFISNNANHCGGAIYCAASNPILVDVSMYNNQGYGGGIYLLGGSHPVIVNSILWNGNDNIYFDSYGEKSITITNSNISGGLENIAGSEYGTINWLEDNINEDPLFADAFNGNLMLTKNSPCIDKGTAFFVWEEDTLVNMRESEYFGSAPDMGAYEFVDINHAPLSFNLLQPNDKDTLDIADIEFMWERSKDIDGDDVLYIFHMTGNNLDTMIHSISDTVFNFSNHNILQNNQKYNWLVYATDGLDTTECSASFDFYTGTSTGIDLTTIIPVKYNLSQNYPNPFNPLTQIKFGLPKESKVKLEIYNSLGQKVATLLNTHKPAGYHEVTFDGSKLASGVYIYRLTTNNSFSQTKKMILIR